MAYSVPSWIIFQRRRLMRIVLSASSFPHTAVSWTKTRGVAFFFIGFKILLHGRHVLWATRELCRFKVNPFLPFRLSESTGVIVGTVVDEEGALFNMDAARGEIGTLVRRTDEFLVYYLQDLCGSAQ